MVFLVFGNFKIVLSLNIIHWAESVSSFLDPDEFISMLFRTKSQNFVFKIAVNWFSIVFNDFLYAIFTYIG
jgi:hypothetical protein